jgi:hypothetical protein
VAADGTVVAAWSQGVTFGGPSHVYARRFGTGGQPLFPAVPVDDVPGRVRVDEPRVAATPDGGFVAGWLGYPAIAPGPLGGDLYLRRFQADGSPAGPGARLNEREIGSTPPLYGLDVAEDGRLVVVWPEFNGDPVSGVGLFGRLFEPDGTPAGSTFQVDRPGIRFPEHSSVRFTKGGGFFVLWRGSTSYPQSPGNDIYGRRFAADGRPRGAEIEIARPGRRVTLEQPALALNEDGRGAAVWVDLRFDPEINARRLLQAAP